MAVTLKARDIQSRHVLTLLIKKKLHEDSSLGAQIAPMKAINTRKFKVAIREFTPAGVGQFKAINANTPIFRGGGTVEEVLETLVDLEEMEVIHPDDLIRLNSPDEDVANAAKRDIAEIGLELAIRNRNRTRWMRWKAFQDALTLTFNDGTAYDVDYDLDNSNGGMSASHIVTATNEWNTQTITTAITDLQTWVDLIGTDLGVDGAWMHVNKKTFRTMQRIDEIESYLLDHYGPLKIPDADAMKKIFQLDGGIVVENGYWEDTDGTRNYYIPEGYALITSPYQVDDAPIAGVYDGPVVMWQDPILLHFNCPHS